jgi:hypothetical protein
MTRRRTEIVIASLGALTAVNAVGGCIYGLSGAPNVPREWLDGYPFRDYRVPSLILGGAVGGSSAGASATAWRASGCAGTAALGAGVVLTGWIATQVAIIGPRSPLQPLMAGVGIVMTGLGASLRCQTHATNPQPANPPRRRSGSAIPRPAMKLRS